MVVRVDIRGVPQISVVVPCFGCTGTLAALHERLTIVLENSWTNMRLSLSTIEANRINGQFFRKFLRAIIVCGSCECLEILVSRLP